MYSPDEIRAITREQNRDAEPAAGEELADDPEYLDWLDVLEAEHRLHAHVGAYPQADERAEEETDELPY